MASLLPVSSFSTRLWNCYDGVVFFAFHFIFEILDWVAQPSPIFKSQLNRKCKLNSCTFQTPGKFKCQLSLN